MKAVLYCGSGDGRFWVAATEHDELMLAGGRVPAVGEHVMPAPGCAWYHVVSVAWQFGASPAVEITAIADPGYEPLQMTVIPPPGRVTG